MLIISIITQKQRQKEQFFSNTTTIKEKRKTYELHKKKL